MRGTQAVLRNVAMAAKARRGRRALADARVATRLGTPLLALVAVALTTLALAGFALAVVIDRAGLFDPPLVRPLPDDRILANLRDSDAPFVGGAVLADGAGRVVLLRQDGQLARFDAASGRVATTTITSDQTGLTTDLAGLSAGCGRLQPVTDGVACPAPDDLFVVSADGGLAQARGGADWQVRLRDAPWQGLNGTPVEQTDVVAWSSSADGRLVAVFAGAQGVGLFDQQQDRWSVLAQVDRLVAAAALGPVHLLHDDKVFWFGTARGLARLDPARLPLTLDWSQESGFAVRDLDVTPAGALLALTEGPCAAGDGAGCLAIEAVSGPNQRDALVGEVERIATLSNASLLDAVLQGDQIVAVARGGLFAYDPTQRTWRTLRAGPVDAFWIAADTGAVTATMADLLVRVERGKIAQSRQVAGAPFTQVEVSAEGRIIGLGRDGQLRDLATDAVLASRDGALPDGMAFRTGAALDDLVLLAGPQGLLLHDVRERRFQWIAASSLATDLAPLLAGTAKLMAADGSLWMVDPGQGRLATLTLTGSFPRIAVRASPGVMLAAPLRAIASEPDAMHVVDRAGRPFQLLVGVDGPALQSPVGAPRQGDGAFRTAAALGHTIAFATERQIWTYDQQDRRWSPPFAPPPQEEIADIAGGDSLYLLTPQGRVYRQDGGGWAGMIGRGDVAQLALADMTDALATDRALYLAGDGVVQVYDTGLGGLTQSFGGGRGNVRLVGVTAGQPVWLSDRVLRHGETAMTSAPVLGAWSARDGIVALAVAPDGSNFALHWPAPARVPTCSFFSAAPPAGEVIDAVALPGDQVLTVTTDGVGLHLAAERRWLRVTGLTPAPDLRLYLAAGYLVAVTDERLRAMPLTALAVPPSCDAPEIALDWDLDERGDSVAFDPGRATAVILIPGGEVRQWRAGTVTQLLPAPLTGPDPAGLLQMIQHDDTLIFAAPGAIWRYDLATRLWDGTAFALPAEIGQVQEVDLALVDDQPLRVTLWTGDGRSWVGTWAEGQQTVRLQLAGPQASMPVATPPQEIRDIVQRDDLWVIGSATGLEVTQPGRSRPLARVTYPDGAIMAPTPLVIGPALAFVAGPPDRPDEMFFLPPQTAFAGLSGALRDLTFGYRPGLDRAWGLAEDGRRLWRIDVTGALLACDVLAGQSSPATCAKVLAAPVTLDPARITEIFGIGPATYLHLGDGIVHLDPSYRVMTPVSGPQPQAGAQAINWAGGLYYWDGPGGQFWHLAGIAAGSLTGPVQRLTMQDDALLAETADGLLRFSPDAPRAPLNLNATLPLAALSFDWVGGGAVIGLGPDGRVRAEDGRVLFDLPVPDPLRIDRVAVPRSGQVWVQRRDGSLDGYRAGQCETPPHPVGVFLPCAQALPGSHLADPGLGPLLSASDAGGIVLRFAGGDLRFDGAGYGPVTGEVPPFSAAVQAADISPAVRALIVTGADGRGELAPARISQGAFRVTDGVGTRLADLAPRPAPLPPLALGWLNWDRPLGQFDVERTDGTRQWLLPGAFIQDGLALPQHPGVARAAGGGDHDWITRDGIWRFDTSGDDPLLDRLTDLPAPVGLQAGRVLFADGAGLSPDAAGMDVDNDRNSLQKGALSLAATWRAPDVAARITQADGATVPAFAAEGFAHDSRATVGWSVDGPVLITPVGLVPVSGFATILPLPAGQQPTQVVTVAGETMAQAAGRWWVYRSDLSRWIATPDPLARRVLIRGAGVTWTLDAGALTIAADDSAQDWRVQRDGLLFAADRLVALAATDRHVVIGTALGTHSQTEGAEIAALGAPLQDRTPPGAFDALSVRPGQTVVFAFDPSGMPVIWDLGAADWVAAPADSQPWDHRQAIATAQFEIDFTKGAAPVARRLVTQADGRARFAPFDWQRGVRWPFDRATAVFAESGTVYVGTQMGLRVIGGPGDRLIDLGTLAPQKDRPVEAVVRVGRPANDPGRLMASGAEGGCLDISAGPTGTACTDPAILDTLWVTGTDLWQWRKSADDLTGDYLLHDGLLRPIPTDPQGRWPHDTLASRATCGGGPRELWSDGQTLRGDGVTQALSTSGWAAFLCQPGALLRDGALQVEAGLYLVSGAGQVPLRREGPAGWGSVGAKLATAIAELASGHWAYHGRRLRIAAQGRADEVYQFRPDAGIWQTMPWQDGLPQMDKTLGLVTDAGRVLRLTPLGLVAQEIGANSLAIDPDQVRFRTTADPERLRNCRPERLARLDGRRHSLEMAEDVPVVMRCAEGVILRENTGTSADQGAFDLAQDDPFAARVAIDQADGWRWTLGDAVPGRDPTVVPTFRSETVSLSAGRFDLDDYRALAAPFAGQVAVVTGQGLWLHPDGQFGLTKGGRPATIPDARSARGVTADRDQDTQAPLLCLQRAQMPPVAYDSGGAARQVAACGDWRGADALFQYRQQDQSVATAVGLASNGPLIARNLAGGRFDDRIAIGLPQPAGDAGDLLVPTARGATVLGMDGQTKAIQAHGDLLGVMTLADAGPAALTRSGVFPLGGQADLCPSLSAAAVPWPDDSGIATIMTRGRKQTHLRSTGPGGPILTTIRCDETGLLALADDLRVDARLRHRAHLRGQAGATASVIVTQQPGGPLILWDGQGRHVPLPQVAGQVTGVFGSDQPREILVLTRDEAYLIDVDAALSALAKAASSVNGPDALDLLWGQP